MSMTPEEKIILAALVVEGKRLGADENACRAELKRITNVRAGLSLAMKALNGEGKPLPADVRAAADAEEAGDAGEADDGGEVEADEPELAEDGFPVDAVRKANGQIMDVTTGEELRPATPKPAAGEKPAASKAGRPSKADLLAQVRELGKRLSTELGKPAEASKIINDSGHANWKEAPAAALKKMRDQMQALVDEVANPAPDPDADIDFD